MVHRELTILDPLACSFSQVFREISCRSSYGTNCGHRRTNYRHVESNGGFGEEGKGTKYWCEQFHSSEDRITSEIVSRHFQGTRYTGTSDIRSVQLFLQQ